jgi:hypothetical protein
MNKADKTRPTKPSQDEGVAMRALIIVAALLAGLSSAGAGTVYDRNGNVVGTTTITERV